MAVLSALSGGAVAQQAGQGLRVVPTFRVQETLTDNRDLSTNDKQAEAITQLSPGVQITSSAGRVKGSLTYSLNALLYARESRKNTLQNALNAAFSGVLVENSAFVDVNARIAQQTVSAFGSQPAGTGLDGGNTTETSSLSISPSVRSRIAGAADLTGRVSWSMTNSASTDAGDGSSLAAQLGLSDRRGYFGWAVNASRTESDFKVGRKTTQDSAVATLQLFPVYELQLSLRGGWEATDVQTGVRQSNDTWGWGADYRPGPRTSVSLQSDHRYFGQSHTFSVQHRMARSVWSFSDTRDVSAPPGVANDQQLLTAYDLFYLFCVRAGGDAATCDQATRAELALRGLQPTDLVSTSLLASALTLQRSQRVSVAYSGLRSTFTLSGFRSATSKLDNLVIAGEDLSQAEKVRQQGFSIGASHRVTPSASVALTLSQQKTLDAGPLEGNTTRSALLSWTDKLGRTIDGSLSLRRTLSKSATTPYNESALIGSLSLRF